MTSTAQNILDFLKLAPRYFVTLCGSAAFLLFSPERMLKYIGVFDFAKNYRPSIGLVFIVSSAHLGVTIMTKMAKWFKGNIEETRINKRILEGLHGLTEDEKKIIRFYLFNQTKTNELSIEDGVVQGLASKGIIYRSSDIGDARGVFHHNISDTAWYCVNINPGLLEGDTQMVRTDRRISRW